MDSDRYRDALRHEGGRADGTARELMDAGRALDEHAHQVEERLRQTASVEHWFSNRIHDARHIVSQVVLDGQDNPDRPNWTTVTRDVGDQTSGHPIATHSSDLYAHEYMLRR